MHPLSDIRIRNNKVVMRMLQRYELFVRLTHPRKRHFTLYIDDVDNAMLHDIWKYAKNEHIYRENYPELFEKAPEKRPSKPRGDNTLIDYFCKIRTFFRWCYDNELTQNRPFDKFHLDEPVYGTPVFITLEERDKLLDATYDDERLAKQRDIFVFQTLIGCRVSDLYAMTRTNIINDAIEYIAGKTVDGNPRTIRVPRNSIGRTILKKYEWWQGKSL
jgi:site-specific recombinase XerD